MAEGKKIQFGFTKVIKTSLVKPVVEKKTEVDFVDSFDGSKGEFSLKGITKPNEPAKKILVIPMPGSKTAFEVIKEKLEAKQTPCKVENEDLEEKPVIKEEPVEVQNDPALSLEELAAREIIENIKKEENTETPDSGFVIPQDAESSTVKDGVESTLDDYDDVPVNEFGLAMLRGMGWKADKGVGKEEKLVKPIEQKLRPKGLGLGADKVIQKSKEVPEDLKISKKSCVKFISGCHQGKYGIVEGMDEDTGRIVVNLALGGTISATEAIVVPVTKKDYETNAKVLNSAKYEKHKDDSSVKQEIKHKDDSSVKQEIKHKDDSSVKQEIKHKNTSSYKVEERLEVTSKSDKHYSRQERSSRKKSPKRHKSRERKYSSSPTHNRSRVVDNGAKKYRKHERSSSPDIKPSKRYRSRERRRKSSSRSPNRNKINMADKYKTHKSRKYESLSSDSEYETKKKMSKQKHYRDSSSSSRSRSRSRHRKTKTHNKKSKKRHSSSSSDSDYRHSKRRQLYSK